MNRTAEKSRWQHHFRAALGLGVVGLLPLAIGACGEKKQAQAPAPVETAAAPIQEREAPKRDPLDGLALDPKVVFPRTHSPSSRDIAEAVASLAGAIAEGDSRSLHPMLDKPNQVILDDLVQTGAWQQSTGSISQVRVCTLEENGQSILVGLGVEDPDGAYLLGWSGERLGGGWLFSGIALDTPASAMTAAELDEGSLAARDVPEPGAIVDDTFDPTANDPRRDEKSRRRGSRGGSGGGGRRGL